MGTGTVFDRFADQGFIKTNEHPTVSDSALKASLNRKGNVLFNDGQIEAARRIFLTTGYSDGLTRVGDYYRKQGRTVDALKMYWLAPDRKKAEELIAQMAMIIQNLAKEEEEKYER